MFPILHISDLHRSPGDPVNNATLVAALLSDRDRYPAERPAVPCPEAIVVSGDIIRGAPLGTKDHAQEIQRQYEVAHNFLADLTDRFFAGDRSKVVIVPGNHDVCWNTARSAMSVVPPTEDPTDIQSALQTRDSTYRWSWQERQLYKITSPDTYRRRFDAYWDFLDRFYAATPLTFPIDRDRGFNLFELDDRNIIVAAFDSLRGNDCFALSGNIMDDSIATCSLAIRDAAHQYTLQLAVWHHSVHGPPDRSDYMNVDAIYQMTGHGFRLGLHGHQHYAQALAHYTHLPEKHAMAVVGAGSLCAGHAELPRGIDRQYNIVVIDDDYKEATVHVREMQQGSQFGRTHRASFGLSGSIRLRWNRPVDLAGRTVEPTPRRERAAVSQAETAMSAGDYSTAIALLDPVLRSHGTYASKLYTEALHKSGQWAALATWLSRPTTAEELTLLVTALANAGHHEEAQQALAQYSESIGLTRPVLRDLNDHLELRKMAAGEL